MSDLMKSIDDQVKSMLLESVKAIMEQKLEDHEFKFAMSTARTALTYFEQKRKEEDLELTASGPYPGVKLS